MARSTEIALITASIAIAAFATASVFWPASPDKKRCAPLNEPADSCMGTIAELTNGTLQRVWLQTYPLGNDISPEEAANLKEEHKIVRMVDPSNQDFPNLTARHAIQPSRQ